MTLLATNVHIAREDRHPFLHEATDKSDEINDAQSDVLLDLRAAGYMQPRDSAYWALYYGTDNERTEVVDDRALATCTVAVTASDDGACTIEAGQVFVVSADAALPESAQRRFTADSTVVIAAGDTEDVPCTATLFGRHHNVREGALGIGTAPDNYTACLNAAATGGADHQLTRAITFKTLELLFREYARKAGDALDDRRALYHATYKDHIKALIKAGLDTVDNVPPTMLESRVASYAPKRLRRS